MSKSAPVIVLTEDEKTLAESLAHSGEAALVTRADLTDGGPTIVGASAGMTALTGYDVDELRGRTPRMFQGPLTERAVLDRLRESCARGERFVGEAVNYGKGGAAYLVQWTVEPIRDAAGRTTHFFSVQRDVTPERPFAQAWLDAESRARRSLEEASARAAVIVQAMLVLEKTKRSFQSRELGELRRQLARALEAGGSDGRS